MDLERLRDATAADHLAVEGAVPLMGDGVDVATYVMCLRRLHGVVSAWETHAAGNAPVWLQATVRARSRRAMLERDLAWFGVEDGDEGQATLPEMRGDAGVLGAMYVMEGSTLGGQLIARNLSRVLGLREGHGDSFFRGHGEQTGAMWKEFCGILRTRVDDSESDDAIEGARGMFRAFGSWMHSPQAR